MSLTFPMTPEIFVMFRRTRAKGSPVVPEICLHVVLDALRGVAAGEFVVHEQLGGLRRHGHEVFHGDRAQRVAHRLLRLGGHVAPDEAGIGEAHFGHRFAGAVVRNLRGIEAHVRLAFSEKGQMDHQYTPSTTVWFNSENGRTLRTPS